MEVLGVKLELSIKDGAAVEGRVLGDGAVTTGLCLLLGEATVVLREAWDGPLLWDWYVCVPFR